MYNDEIIVLKLIMSGAFLQALAVASFSITLQQAQAVAS